MRATVFASFVLSACATAPVPSADQPGSLADLQGQYRIVRFDDYRPAGREREAAELRIDGDTLQGSIVCNGGSGRVEWRAPNVVAPAPDTDFIITTALCTHRDMAQEGPFFSMLGQPMRVQRMDNGRLHLKTDDHELVVTPRP